MPTPHKKKNIKRAFGRISRIKAEKKRRERIRETVHSNTVPYFINFSKALAVQDIIRHLKSLKNTSAFREKALFREKQKSIQQTVEKFENFYKQTKQLSPKDRELFLKELCHALNNKKGKLKESNRKEILEKLKEQGIKIEKAKREQFLQKVEKAIAEYQIKSIKTLLPKIRKKINKI